MYIMPGEEAFPRPAHPVPPALAWTVWILVRGSSDVSEAGVGRRDAIAICWRGVAQFPVWISEILEDERANELLMLYEEV